MINVWLNKDDSGHRTPTYYEDLKVPENLKEFFRNIFIDFDNSCVNMKLFEVVYQEWTCDFTKLVQKRRLSVGKDENEAIEKVKEIADQDARDFAAIPINKVFGHKIIVEN